MEVVLTVEGAACVPADCVSGQLEPVNAAILDLYPSEGFIVPELANSLSQLLPSHLERTAYLLFLVLALALDFIPNRSNTVALLPYCLENMLELSLDVGVLLVDAQKSPIVLIYAAIILGGDSRDVEVAQWR